MSWYDETKPRAGCVALAGTVGIWALLGALQTIVLARRLARRVRR